MQAYNEGAPKQIPYMILYVVWYSKLPLPEAAQDVREDVGRGLHAGGSIITTSN